MTKLTGVIFALWLAFAVVPTLAATEKVALVIGNSAYKNVTPLFNPGNDAKAIKAMLAGLGFEVVDGVDLTKIKMEKLIRSFAVKANSAEVSLVYYAGHAIQVNGKNYLIPVDAVVEDELSLNFELIDLDSITNLLSTEKSIGIILLDACRDNPFTRSLSRSLKSGRSVQVNKGLAMPSGQGGGLLIGFATAPGTIAQDGEKSIHSPFTKALLKHLPTPGFEIEQLLKRVKADVAAETNNEQRPWHNSDLTKEVYLASTAAASSNDKNSLDRMDSTTVDSQEPAMGEQQEIQVILSDEELNCFKRIVYFEGMNLDYDTKVNVARFVMARLKSADNAKTFCGILHEGSYKTSAGSCVFRFACDDKLDVVTNSLEWQRAETIVGNAVLGVYRDYDLPPIKESLYSLLDGARKRMEGEAAK